MHRKLDERRTPADLRRAAEEQAARQEAANAETLTPQATRRVLHELRVHQIELETQNEELRRAQVALETARARYFDLYDLAPVGYLTLSEAGLIPEANLTAATLLGVARNALANRHFSEVIAGEDQDTYYLSCKRLFETRQSQTCDLRLRRADGAAVWVRVNAIAVCNADTGAPLCRATLSDITALKDAEQALGVKEAELRQAQKMEAIGHLAGGVAHEFNNLLMVILGSVASARFCRPDDADLTDLLDRIDEAGHQAAGVTKGLLAFAHKGTPQRRIVDLCALLDHAVRLLRQMLPATVELAVDHPRDQPVWVSADETQLMQAVLNLAVNARDAMPQGGSLRIALTQSPNVVGVKGAMGPHAHLEVRDTGVGMTPDVRRQIFDPFFTTKSRGQGTGLGLAVTHAIVRDHEGQIAVDSTPGQGTTFTIVLPCAAPAAETEGTLSEAPAVRGRGELILAAEDHPEVRAIIAAALRADGYEVLTVTDGDAALRVFEQHRARLAALVLDLDLPKRSGLDVLRQLRAAGHRLPALLVTGNIVADVGDDPDTVLLRKPFRPSELCQLLRTRLHVHTHAELPR